MSDDVTIYDIMKNTIKFSGERHLGEMGVEIETESLKRYEYPGLKYWNCVADNSLRNYGVEYVLKAPMNQKDFTHALNEFNVCRKKYNFLPNEVSTSVHVHLNFLNDSYKTLANFFTAYALVENLLVIYSGPDRMSNLFCLPMRDAEGVFTAISDVINAINRKAWMKIAKSVDQVKYSGLNIAPLTRLGTIEVRTFRGETDPEIIKTWTDILMKIKEYSRRDITPSMILNRYKELGAGIVDEIFGDYAKLLKCKDYENLIKQNVYYAATFATSCKDWENFGVFKVKKVYKEKLTKQLDELSIEKFRMPYSELDWTQRVVLYEMYARINPNVRVVEQQEDI